MVLLNIRTIIKIKIKSFSCLQIDIILYSKLTDGETKTRQRRVRPPAFGYRRIGAHLQSDHHKHSILLLN